MLYAHEDEYYVTDFIKEYSQLPGAHLHKSDTQIIIEPHKQQIVKDFYWTDHLKNLQPGLYWIAIDYVDEFKDVALPKNDSIVARYYRDDPNISSGAYMQFSKNTIRFTVVE